MLPGGAPQLLWGAVIVPDGGTGRAPCGDALWGSAAPQPPPPAWRRLPSAGRPRCARCPRPGSAGRRRTAAGRVGDGGVGALHAAPAAEAAQRRVLAARVGDPALGAPRQREARGGQRMWRCCCFLHGRQPHSSTLRSAGAQAAKRTPPPWQPPMFDTRPGNLASRYLAAASQLSPAACGTPPGAPTARPGPALRAQGRGPKSRGSAGLGGMHPAPTPQATPRNSAPTSRATCWPSSCGVVSGQHPLPW